MHVGIMTSNWIWIGSKCDIFTKIDHIFDADLWNESSWANWIWKNSAVRKAFKYIFGACAFDFKNVSHVTLDKRQQVSITSTRSSLVGWNYEFFFLSINVRHENDFTFLHNVGNHNWLFSIRSLINAKHLFPVANPIFMRNSFQPHIHTLYRRQFSYKLAKFVRVQKTRNKNVVRLNRNLWI